MAQAMGIPVPWVYTGVFAIGAAMAAASGVLFGPLGSINHTMGLDWVLKAFIVVVVGGMGNLGGSIAAAIFVSLLESYAAIWVDPSPRGDRLLRRADPHFAVPSNRPVRDTKMTTAPLDKTDAAQQSRIEPHGRLLDRLLRGHGGADRRAAGVAGLLGEVPDRDPDLGPAGDVVRSVDRLHRHDLVRPFGLLRARHVRRGRRAAAHQPAESVGRDFHGPRRRGLRRAVRRLFLDAPARHLFRHHHADFLADLLRHHLHLDGSDRRRERADLHTAAFLHSVSRRRALHDHDDALVRAGAGRRLLSDPAPRHPLAVRHGAAIDPRERGAHPRHRLSRSSATRSSR